MYPSEHKFRLTPREWQRSALVAWQVQERGIVEVVTGGGKTVFAFMCIREFWRHYPDGKVVVLVPTIALADQWYVGLQEDMGCSPEDLAVFSGGERSQERALVNIAILNTARTLAPQLYSGAPTFLIVDECHRAATPVNAKALQGDFVAALGLSATPTREYDEGLETYLTPSLGPLIFRYTYEDAAHDHVISRFALKNVRVDLLPSESDQLTHLTNRIRRAFHRFRNTGDDAVIKRLARKRAAVSASAAMRIPVAARLIDQHRGERAIVFHEQIRGAERIASILRSRNHSVTTYHSKIAPNVRRDNLRLYRKGVFDVLVSCRALDEGLNIPETAVAVVASSTASERQRIQRLGRVLRPSVDKELAVVYTLYATDSEEKRLLVEAEKMQSFARVEWKRSRMIQNG